MTIRKNTDGVFGRFAKMAQFGNLSKKGDCKRHVTRNRRLPPPHRHCQGNRVRHSRAGFGPPFQILLRHGVRHPQILFRRPQRRRARLGGKGIDQNGKQQAVRQSAEGAARRRLVEFRRRVRPNDGRGPLVRRGRLRRPKALWQSLRIPFPREGWVVGEEGGIRNGVHGDFDRGGDFEGEAPDVPFHEDTLVRGKELPFCEQRNERGHFQNMRQAAAPVGDFRLRQGVRRFEADGAHALAQAAFRHKDAGRQMARLRREADEDVRPRGEEEGQNRRAHRLQRKGNVREGEPRRMQDTRSQSRHDGGLLVHGGEGRSDGFDDRSEGLVEGGSGPNRPFVPFPVEDRGAFPIQKDAVRVREFPGEIPGVVEFSRVPPRRRASGSGHRHRKEGNEFPLFGADGEGQGGEGGRLPGILQDGDGGEDAFHGKQKRGEELSKHTEEAGCAIKAF